MCQSVSHAPWHDLCLYKKLIRYKQINETISAAAVKAFNRHLWYLTPELVVLALFGKSVPSNERKALAKALMNIKPAYNLPDRPTMRHGVDFGKPMFPVLPTEDTTLADLISEDSWWTVKLLNMNLDFLNENFEEWDQT